MSLNKRRENQIQRESMRSSRTDDCHPLTEWEDKLSSVVGFGLSLQSLFWLGAMQPFHLVVNSSYDITGDMSRGYA